MSKPPEEKKAPKNNIPANLEQLKSKISAQEWEVIEEWQQQEAANYNMEFMQKHTPQWDKAKAEAIKTATQEALNQYKADHICFKVEPDLKAYAQKVIEARLQDENYTETKHEHILFFLLQQLTKA